MSDPGVEALRASVDSLAAGVSTLNDELVATNGRLTKQTRALWFAIGGPGLVVAVVLVVGMFIVLDNRSAIEENNRRWCPMLALILPDPGASPPTEEGREFVAEAESLYRDYGCR